MPGRMRLMPELCLLCVCDVSVPFRSNSRKGLSSCPAPRPTMSRKCCGA